jgi:hypothetical protein
MDAANRITDPQMNASQRHLKFLADENGIGKQITGAKHVLSPSAESTLSEVEGLRIDSVEGTQSMP